jgi:hypothetical protein
LRAAFAESGALWQQWRNALAPIVRNEAATTIARHLGRVANLHKGTPAPVSPTPDPAPTALTRPSAPIAS